ncbi:uncharacterized protein LOC126898144 [Daktulosphaira vitifoliae]|uniref:uncharacterized protein LOC126898144 n=1 Tax=Daktulosphaira vitifoliae TaxID=58002 RepID=UPI0021AA5EC9|nr:uncharacterized protein LOC126898144 [Daktulosphaira vitifoliae]
MREELLKLADITERTRGTDVCDIVVNELKKLNINLKKIISVTTDGAPNMTGAQIGFVKLFEKHVEHPIIGFHCIIHQKMLCSKIGTNLFDMQDFDNNLLNWMELENLEI